MLNETISLLLRRWPFVALAVVASVLLGFAGWAATPLQHQSQAQVLFLPPTQQPGVDGKVNPFLFFGASLGITADIVRINVTDDDSREVLVSRGALPDYEVTPYLAENGGPILIVSAKGDDGAATQRSVQVVARAIQDDLAAVQRQAEAPGGSEISATLLTQTPTALPIIKNRIRVSVVVGAASLVLLLALLLLVERWLSRPRRSEATSDLLPTQGADDASGASRLRPSGSERVPAIRS
ncbi:MAG TPA: hypothetical protein VF661_06130 [Actinomycetales bacterium]